MYKNLQCPLNCESTDFSDTQDHVLQCDKLRNASKNIKLSHIFGSLMEQEQAAKLLTKLMRKRNSLLEAIETT